MTITAESLRELAGKKASEFDDRPNPVFWAALEKWPCMPDAEMGFRVGAELFLPALVEALKALDGFKLGHSHTDGGNHLRAMGETYGWCDFCQEKVSFTPGYAEEKLAEISAMLGEIEK